MSTRGVVAVGSAHNWKGIYNHSDSYPAWLGKELYGHLTEQIIKGEKTLAEIGESILKFDDWCNYLKGGVCEYCGKIASQPHTISGDIFGNTKPGIYLDPDCKNHKHEPLGKIDYFRPKDIAESWCEWGYVIDPRSNVVHVLDFRQYVGDKRQITHVGEMNFKDKPEFQILECGANFERCEHYAWAHFPEIDREGPQQRLNTKQYIGVEPVEGRDYACAFIIDGKRYIPTGSGVRGEYAALAPSLTREIPRPKSGVWYEQVKAANGKRKYVPVSIMDRKEKPYPGVTWVYPPTKVNPQETFQTL